MKPIITFLFLTFLTNCTTHSVQLGKKCTNNYEKSIIWIVDNQNIENFETKINKENCKINGEKS